MPYPSRYTVHYTVTTHHRIVVGVPEDTSTGESTAMSMVRRMDPFELRRHEAVGTTSYVLKAEPLED